MAARPSLAVLLLGALASLGASFRTQNFVVQAATPEIAQRVGQYAEYYRREKALLWLGREMPTWGRPCPLHVTVSMNGSSGATSFAFDNGRILDITMKIEGTLDRLLASVLPHEVTHTVFAYYFRCPVPRWADEGGSVLSEDEPERRRHDLLVRQILNSRGRAIPLSRLFSLTQYPPDVMVLYAEGYSVTNFLVGLSNRQAFLAFIAHGMRGDWDAAVRTHYRYRSVAELEQAWLQSLRNPRPAAQVASAGPRPYASPASRVVVRQTVPPAQPVLMGPRPVFRGAGPSDTEGTWAPGGRPDVLPSSSAPSAAPCALATPAAAPPSPGGFALPPPPSVRLGPPMPGPLGPGSPVGYSP
jgi:hypothetical protein